MLKYGFTIVTSTVHTECDKYCPPPALFSERCNLFGSCKQVLEIGEILKGQTNSPSYIEGLCLCVDLSPSSSPTLPPFWKSTVPHHPFLSFSTLCLPSPLNECCKTSFLISVDRPRIPCWELGVGGLLSLYILPDLPPAHSSTQKYPCSYQQFWS